MKKKLLRLVLRFLIRLAYILRCTIRKLETLVEYSDGTVNSSKKGGNDDEYEEN